MLVLADRKSTNAVDGSSRRELDIKYQVNYTDGTVDPDARATLISGSSAGSVMAPGQTCSTPQSGSNWRFYGNRAVVDASIRAANERDEFHSLATGALRVSNPVQYSKFVQFRIADPGNFAKYVVVTGSGLPPSGVKMVSVRLLRADPLLAGKRGNYLDWKDDDSFRFCQGSSNSNSFTSTAANVADCVAFGGSSSTLGVQNSSASAVDTSFDALGFVAGGAYQLAVYNDNGWQTVNGQATQTPIATYTRTLLSLPYSAVTMAGTGVDNDLFARITSTSLTNAQIATAFRTKASFTMDFSFTALGDMADSSKFGWGDVVTFESGNASASPSFWPQSRQYFLAFPAAGATSVTNYLSPAPTSVLVTPTFGEIGIELSNRNGRRVWSYVVFN